MESRPQIEGFGQAFRAEGCGPVWKGVITAEQCGAPTFLVNSWGHPSEEADLQPSSPLDGLTRAQKKKHIYRNSNHVIPALMGCPHQRCVAGRTGSIDICTSLKQSSCDAFVS